MGKTRRCAGGDGKRNILGQDQPTPLPQTDTSIVEQPGGRRPDAGICRLGRGGGQGGRGVCQATPRPRRTTASGRSTKTGFMPTLALTLTAESGTKRRGQGGGMTLRSYHHGDMTRQAESLGDASWWNWCESCKGCGIDIGTWSSSLYSRR